MKFKCSLLHIILYWLLTIWFNGNSTAYWSRGTGFDSWLYWGIFLVENYSTMRTNWVFVYFNILCLCSVPYFLRRSQRRPSKIVVHTNPLHTGHWLVRPHQQRKIKVFILMAIYMTVYSVTEVLRTTDCRKPKPSVYLYIQIWYSFIIECNLWH